MDVLHKLLFRVKAICLKIVIPEDFWGEINKFLLKFRYKCKGPRIAKIILKRRINLERERELAEQQQRVNHFLGLIQKETNEINKKHNQRLEELSSYFLVSLGKDSRMKQTTSFKIKKKKRGENNGKI